MYGVIVPYTYSEPCTSITVKPAKRATTWRIYMGGYKIILINSTNSPENTTPPTPPTPPTPAHTRPPYCPILPVAAERADLAGAAGGVVIVGCVVGV